MNQKHLSKINFIENQIDALSEELDFLDAQNSFDNNRIIQIENIIDSFIVELDSILKKYKIEKIGMRLIP